jgi:UrcA family protein
MNRQIRITAAVATLVACFVFESAHAGPARVAPFERVSLSGLNLDTEADAKILYGRLKKAAMEVCQRVVGQNVSLEVGRCSSQLLDIAVSEVNRPALTALHGKPAAQLSAQR